MKKLWYLRRLSRLGASTATLLTIYKSAVRRVMEMAAPVFAGGLSVANSDAIESVQKSAFKIILRGKYQTYQNALLLLNENTLEERRESISLKFAKKSTQHPKMSHLFNKKKHSKTRKGKKNFIEPRTFSNRAFNGPVPYLIRLLNSQGK